MMTNLRYGTTLVDDHRGSMLREARLRRLRRRPRHGTGRTAVLPAATATPVVEPAAEVLPV
jgi:hypothetical protein